MSVGSIIGLNPGETDPLKINAAVRQLLERNGGKQINASIATTGPTYAALASDFMIEVSGNTVVTLPSASAAPGQIYCVKKMDAAGTTTTIDNSIDGSTSATLTTSYQSLLIQSNATRWDALIRSSTAVDVSPFLRTANALSELSTNAVAARTNIGITGNIVTHNSTEYLTLANILSELTTSATTARSNISAAAKAQTFFVTGTYNVPSGTPYDIIVAPFGMTLTKFNGRLLAGTVTATLNIGSTAVTNGALSASTVLSSATPSGNNVLSAGDVLTVAFSGASGASMFMATIQYTTTLS